MSQWDGIAVPVGAPADQWAGIAVPASPAAPQPTAQAQPSTMGYIGSRLLGGMLQSGKELGRAEMGQLDPYGQNADLQKALQAAPPGQEQANSMIYGQPNVEPPNAAARYGGAVASSVSQNPGLAAIARSSLPMAVSLESIGKAGAFVPSRRRFVAC